MAEKTHQHACSHRSAEPAEDTDRAEPRLVARQTQPEVESGLLRSSPTVELRSLRRLSGLLREHTLMQWQQTLGNHAVQRAVDRSRSVVTPTDDLAERIRAASAGGCPMDVPARERLEAGLDADLSAVKIHTDDEANQLSHSLDAKAFATGQHIFFREGTYRPETTQGLWLLAHEAAHTTQPAHKPDVVSSNVGQLSVTSPTDASEQAADYIATAVVDRTARTTSHVISANSLRANSLGEVNSSEMVSIEPAQRTMGSSPKSTMLQISLKKKTNPLTEEDLWKEETSPEESENPPEEAVSAEQTVKGELVVKCEDENAFWSDQLPREVARWLKKQDVRIFGMFDPVAQIVSAIDAKQEGTVRFGATYKYQLEFVISSSGAEPVVVETTKLTLGSSETAQGSSASPSQVTSGTGEAAKETTAEAESSTTPDEMLAQIESGSEILDKLDKFAGGLEFLASNPDTIQKIKELREKLSTVSGPLSTALDAHRKIRATAELIYVLQESSKVTSGGPEGVKAAARIFDALGKLGKEIPVLGGLLSGYLEFLSLPSTIIEFGKRTFDPKEIFRGKPERGVLL